MLKILAILTIISTSVYAEPVFFMNGNSSTVSAFGDLNFGFSAAPNKEPSQDGLGSVGSDPSVVSDALAYPSPAPNGETSIGFRVQGAGTLDLELELYDAYGSEIYTKSIQATAGYNKVPINKETLGFSLSTGVYYFVLKQSDDVLSKGKFGVLGGKQ